MCITVQESHNIGKLDMLITLAGHLLSTGGNPHSTEEKMQTPHTQSRGRIPTPILDVLDYSAVQWGSESAYFTIINQNISTKQDNRA